MGLTAEPPQPSEPVDDGNPQEILLEFRAGKMHMEGSRVHADPRKGLVRIIRADDSLLHFQWLDRQLNIVEDDQIVFPEEAVFEKVNQASGRVYILRFKEDNRKSFFWMQGPIAEEDERLCVSVNFELHRPLPDMGVEEEPESPMQQVSETSEGAEGVEGSLRDGNIAMNEGSPSTTGAVQLIDLQRILQGLGQVPVPQDTLETMHRDTGPSFSDILKPDIVIPLVDRSSIEERLAPFLPEGVKTPEAVAELMLSPQFQQQLDMFTHVLRTGQLDWAQFGIDPKNYNFTVSSFLEAIQDQFTGKDESIPEGERRTGGQKGDQKKEKDSDVMEEGL
ncbi:hypothetical protein R1sor_014810 [Riccia sorocarpa]|uniref:Regulatory particle non-ATPase 13 n=1 Tax=Riccia sorocarpa TaxID=122646 RepID=A0ABD3HCB2_9MARC